MIFTPSILLRLAVIILAASLLQAGLFSMVEVAGASIWILPALAVCLGLLGGGVTGAVCGFLLGLLSDALTDSPLGTSALALLVVGYLAGIYRERGDAVGPVGAGIGCGVGTAGANLVLGVVIAAIGDGAPLAWGVVSEVIMQALYGFLLGVPLFLFVRRVLAPALVSGQGTRRRRSRVAPGDGI